MTLPSVVHFVHLLAAATWTGGLIVLSATVLALRRAGASREHLRAVARTFGRVSWTAMAIAIATGLWRVHLLGMPWTYGRLHVKIGLVALVVLVAATHQLTARRSKPAVRGVVELVIVLISIAIFAAAVSLSA
ncbi:MAG TPA: hypothetical protein VIL20_18990 [Sandaracinaceae bacterium]